MAPAHQRLRPGDPPRVRIDERLIVQLELLHRRERPGEGRVVGEIGVAQEMLVGIRVVGHDGDAEAGTDVDELALDQEGAAEEVHDVRGQRQCGRGIEDIRLEDRELVAA